MPENNAPTYVSGEPIQVGDRVRIDSTSVGRVVGVIETGEYSNGYNKEHWDHYQNGVLVECKGFGLILYQAEQIDVLVRMKEAEPKSD
jgi:hypothetical protein